MAAEAPQAPVLRFNFEPASYGHSSWWTRSGLPAQVFHKLVRNPAASSMLSKQALEDYHIHNRFDFDFARSFKRIALLAYEQQKRVIFRLGLTIYRERIARALHSAEQERLFEIVDYPDYLQALRLKLEHKLVSAERLPALAFTDRHKFRVAVYLAGFTMLVNIVEQEPAAFKIRYYLTWPKPVALKRLGTRVSALGMRQARAQPGSSQTETFAALPDHARYCLQLDEPELVDQAKDVLKELLAMQGVAAAVSP